jgi:hypothetical protein
MEQDRGGFAIAYDLPPVVDTESAADRSSQRPEIHDLEWFGAWLRGVRRSDKKHEQTEQLAYRPIHRVPPPLD